MNRKSLFGRLSASTIVSRPADRQEYFRLHLEPLEERKLLTTTPTFVDDNWHVQDNLGPFGGQIQIGMTVINLNDSVNPGGISAVYGVDAFGTATSADAGFVSPTSDPTANLIYHAVQNTSNNGVLNILEGTYIESDIVIDHPMTVLGNAKSGAAESLIIPEAESSHLSPQAFSTNSHSGIIIYSPSVTVSNIHLDGSGNAAVNAISTTTLNFHRGITTLFDAQGTAVSEVVTSKVGGTIEATDIFRVKINNNPTAASPVYQTVQITAGSTSAATVAASLVAALNASTQSEFSQLTWADTGGGNFTATADVAGRQFAIVLETRELGDTAPDAQTFTQTTTTANQGNYSSLHNGSLPVIQLNPNNLNRTIPALAVTDVVVDNVFYNGVTIAARGGEQFGTSAGSGLHVDNAFVTNVGDTDLANNTPPVGQDESRVGILMLNLDNNPFGGPLDANVRFSAVTNAGVGVMTGVIGTKSYASQANARNLTGIINTTVTNANKRAFWIDFGDGGEQKSGNTATWTGAVGAIMGPNATGLYINHSEAILEGWVINGALIGIHIQNTPMTGGDQVIMGIGGNFLTGRGTGTGIGVLVNNSALETDSSNVMIGTGTTITNYGTAIKAEQGFAPGNGLMSQVLLVDPAIGTNGAGLDIGAGVNLSGHDPSPTLTTTGASKLSPGFTNWDNYYQLNAGNSATPIYAPSTADIFNVGNLSLNSSTTYAPLLTNQVGSQAFFNFNSSLNYGFAVVPDAPVNGDVPNPQGVLFNWYGNLIQDGTGAIQLGGTATNGKGLDFAFGGKNSFKGGTPPLYHLLGADISTRTVMNIVAKTLPSNLAQTLGVGMFDVRGNANLYTVALTDLNSTAYTTLQINLLAPTIDLTGPDGQIDLTNISGWVFGGDQGAINGNQNIPLRFLVDDIFFTSIGNSQLNVTGTVNLNNNAGGGALLDINNAIPNPAAFTPTAGQQFVIVNNDLADAVSGTFRRSDTLVAMPEGTIVQLGGATGHFFQLSYVGGTGNDVTLTEASPILDLNGLSGAGSSYTTTWLKTGGPVAVNIADPSQATVDDNGNTLVSMTATITGVHTGDVLSADTSGTTLSASYDATNHLLKVTGTANEAEYQTVLRRIKYNNTSGGPGVSPVTFTIVASDGTLLSQPVTSTLTDPPPILDLNGTIGGTNISPTWNVGGGAVNITTTGVDGATVTDLDDPTIPSITATIANPRAGDILSADTTGTSISATWNGSNVLTLYGGPTIGNRSLLADFNDVLRTVKYDNSGDPGGAAAIVNFVASDGVVNSVVATSNVLVSLPLKLGLTSGDGTGFSVFWVNIGPQLIEGSTALLSDTAGTVNTLTATIANPHDNDILAANVSGTLLTASWDATNWTLRVTGTGSNTDYQQVLRTITYNNTVDGPGNQGAGNVNRVTVVFNATDGALNARPVSSVVQNPPVLDLNSNLANGAGGSFAGAGKDVATSWTNVSGAIAITDTDATAFDGGRANIQYMTVQIENFASGHGHVLSATTTGTSITATSVEGVLTLFGPAPWAQFQTVLRTVKYNNTVGGPGLHAPIVVRFMADDDDLKSFTVDPLGQLLIENNAPVLAKATITVDVPMVVDLNGVGDIGLDTLPTWNQTGAISLVESDGIVTYAGTLTSMQVSIVASSNSSVAAMHPGDVLSATLSGGVTSQSFDSTNGVLTLTGAANAATYQTVMRTVKYNNTSPNGGPGAPNVFVNFVGKDGTSVVSNAGQAFITIDRKEDVDLDGAGGTSDYTTTWTGGLINLTDIDALVTDGESTTLSSMTVSIDTYAPTFLPDPNNGLGVNVDIPLVDENIKASGIGTSLLLLAGTDTLANYQTVLRTVQYFNATGGPGRTQLTIRFNYTDAVGADGLQRTTQLAIVVPALVDLNGDTGGSDYSTSWNNTGAVLAVTPTVAQVNTLTVGGTIDTDDKFRVTVTSGIPFFTTTGALTVTGGSTNATTVASTIVAALNASVNPAISAITWATTSGGSFTGTADAAGTPFSLLLETLEGDDSTGDLQSFNQTVTTPNGSPSVFEGDGTNLTSMTATIPSPNAGDVLSATGSGGITVSYDAANFTLKMTGGATAASYQTVLRTVKYNNSGPIDAPSKLVNFVGFDAQGPSTTVTTTITIVLPPEVDLDGPGGNLNFTTSWNNAGPVNISDSDGTANDNSGTIASMTATIVGVHTGDVLSATPAGSIVVSYDSGNHVLNMSGNDTDANYQTVLRSIKYDNTNGSPGVASLTINVVANDGVLNSATAVATINTNAPPAVDLNGSAAGGIDRSVTWSNAGAVNIADAALALVTDTGNIASMTVTIPVAQTGDSLTATASGGIIVSYNAAGQVLNLTGAATPASYQTVLRTVKYTNVSGGPIIGSFVVNVVANDGTNLSPNAQTTVVVQVPPRVDLNGNQVAGLNNYTSTWSNLGAVNIADSIVGVVFNGQAPNLVSMNATLVSPAAGDVLSGTGAGGIVVSYDGANGVLKMTGNATATNYQTVLRSIKYNNSSGPVNLVSKTVNVVGFDATSSSATAVATVTIQPLRLDLNGDLTLGSGYNTFWSNAGAVNITGSTGIPATTLVDGKAANLTSATATIVGVHTGDVLSATSAGGITVSYDAGNHVLNMTGSNTLANYQSVLRSVKYNNTSGGPGVGVITVNFSAVDTNAAVSNATSTTQIVLAGSQVVGRYTFYNQSGTSPTIRYDGQTAGISTLDDGAIALDKVAYIPSATAVPSTFSNVISYDKGINGIMIDLAGSHGTIESTDFIFRVGNNNTPGSAGASWATAPNPASISVRAGAGVGGSDRIEIIWNNLDITKKWLQVVMKTDAGTGTGLAALGGTYAANYGDVFYFGHALANSGQGDSATLSTTDGTDELEARNHAQTVIAFSQINVRDYNRDGAVDSADALLARNNQTTGLAGLNPATRYINLAAGSPPNAPEGDGGDGGGDGGGGGGSAGGDAVPAAITMGSGGSSSSGGGSTWVAESLASAGTSSGGSGQALMQLLCEDDSQEDGNDEDDELNSLLADLGL